MYNIIINGALGRMGIAVANAMEGRGDCRVAAGVDAALDEHHASNHFRFPIAESFETLGFYIASNPKAHPDVLIDFSRPEGTLAALCYCEKQMLPCVICTTGLDAAIQVQMQKTAEAAPVFHSANMSLGVNLLCELARQASALLPGYDIEIVEKHHRHKLDAPSGTALMLADAINDEAGGRYTYVYDRHDRRTERGNDEIGIAAVRGGSIVGEHEVIFAGPNEVVTLAHSAASRDVFAAGAVQAALFVAKQPPGLYSMRDMMEKKE